MTGTVSCFLHNYTGTRNTSKRYQVQWYPKVPGTVVPFLHNYAGAKNTQKDARYGGTKKCQVRWHVFYKITPERKIRKKDARYGGTFFAKIHRSKKYAKKMTGTVSCFLHNCAGTITIETSKKMTGMLSRQYLKKVPKSQ